MGRIYRIVATDKKVLSLKEAIREGEKVIEVPFEQLHLVATGGRIEEVKDNGR
jgi:hypothetical protein